MANKGASGIVRDENGVPLEGLVAHVRHALLPGSPELGSKATVAGSFVVSYSSIFFEAQLEVELTDVFGRQVAPPRRFTDVTVETLDTGVWEVPRAEISGWIATSGAFPPTTGNAIDLLVDNEEAWAAILDAVKAAKKSINFMLFYLDAGKSFMTFSPPRPTGAGAGATNGARLEDALKAAGAAGVEVRLLLNDFMTAPYPTDTADVVQDVVGNAPGIETRRARVPPLAAVHAKVLIVDDVEAYVIGSPFVQDYFDGYAHSLHDPRHGEDRCSKAIKVPVHDVSLRLQGPAVAHLNETFRLHWNHFKPAGAQDLQPAPAPAPLVATATRQVMTTQVTRSLWGSGFFPARPQGERSIYEAYVRAITNAEHYVYLENQYFTLRPLTEVLVRSLKANPKLEVILLTNNKVDIPAYSSWHPGNVTRLLTGLTVAERARVRVFTLWTHEAGVTLGSQSRVGRTYVHSKVAIVDDEWATIGSANLDGVSLLLSEHVVLAGAHKDVRATEANLVVLGAKAGGTTTDLPARLRKLLWAEHLGFLSEAGAPDAAAAELQGSPAGGWVGLWDSRAMAKLASLAFAQRPPSAAPVPLHPARILPWPDINGVTPAGINTAASYLQSFGVAPSGRLEVVETFDFYDFAKDKWV